jgi:hypothetical protein
VGGRRRARARGGWVVPRIVRRRGADGTLVRRPPRSAHPRRPVALAQTAGATNDEIVASLEVALGYDVDSALERLDL